MKTSLGFKKIYDLAYFMAKLSTDGDIHKALWNFIRNGRIGTRLNVLPEIYRQAQDDLYER